MIVDFGNCKNQARLIICLGLTEEQLSIVDSNRPVSNCEVMAAEEFTDILASGQMAAIISWDKMTQWDKDSFDEFYADVAPFPETVIVIGDADIPSELKRRIILYESFEALEKNLKYVLLGAYKKNKKNEDFSSKLSNALQILVEISNRPYITTKQLAEEMEYTSRTVLRYIETLRMAGVWIEYDLNHKGWKMAPEFRIENGIIKRKRSE